MHFSLFYFADDRDSTRPGASGDRYQLLLEGARFADRHNFSAIWTPERHFHAFGGSYPSPAVVGAAVAAVTDRIHIRAGSVVAPLHPAFRIAEDWSVVDNLSGGRVGLSMASGWHATDFALRPENYPNRKEVVVSTLETVRRLWRGESTKLVDGTGEQAELYLHPRPVQPELPLWLTSAGSRDTFRTAGRLGVGVLTHLLGQGLDDLAESIALYRTTLRQEHGSSAGAGHVTLMLHTLLGSDRATVRQAVREPFMSYLRSSASLIVRAAGDLLPGVDPDSLHPDDLEFLVERSFERYVETGGLFGTLDDGWAMLERLEAVGVDEVACLVDFVPDPPTVLTGIHHLSRLADAWRRG